MRLWWCSLGPRFALQGFWYAVLSGASEPVGALIGYFVLTDDADPLVYGITFGLVAGIMVGKAPTALGSFFASMSLCSGF